MNSEVFYVAVRLREKSAVLYQSGREAAEKVFATCNFAEYVDKYRKERSRVGRSVRLRSGL